MKAISAFTLVASLSLAACTSALGPQESGISVSGLWSRLWGADQAAPDLPLASGESVAVEQRWWGSFGDATLDRLIGEALAGNKTLRIAEARVAEARAGRKGAVAELLPTLSATGSASRGNQGVASQNKPVTIKEADLQ